MADYEKYKRHLNESSVFEDIESDRNIDKKVQDISDAIIKAAEVLIPNKIITLRQLILHALKTYTETEVISI